LSQKLYQTNPIKIDEKDSEFNERADDLISEGTPQPANLLVN